MKRHDRISIDPAVMVGKPVIKGTRITVEMILRMLGNGVPEAEIMEAYPHITPEDIKAAQRFAADYMADEEIVYG
jgi:uncharacterized protein (DUF433 family)